MITLGLQIFSLVFLSFIFLIVPVVSQSGNFFFKGHYRLLQMFDFNFCILFFLFDFGFGLSAYLSLVCCILDGYFIAELLEITGNMFLLLSIEILDICTQFIFVLLPELFDFFSVFWSNFSLPFLYFPLYFSIQLSYFFLVLLSDTSNLVEIFEIKVFTFS